MLRIAALVALLVGCSGKKTDSVSSNDLELEIDADPAAETLDVSVQFGIDRSHIAVADRPTEHAFVFTEPAHISQFVDQATGQSLRYRFEPIPGTLPSMGVKRFIVEVPRESERLSIRAKYRYTRDTFAGFFLNPSTDDNLHFGQVRRESIFASHIRYYPSPIASGESPYPLGSTHATSAKIELVVPDEWTAVTAGRLVNAKAANGRKTFTYQIGNSSGRLPYPFSIFRYEEITDRGVSVFFAERDRRFAVEKLALINSKIVPFLTWLMGPPPFEHLRVIEVFPFEGNTGLAARDVVMLSDKIWFAAPIEGNLSSTPAVVLVDEIAHQWNFYKIQLPNYLAEGVSEYTDALFVEHVNGSAALDARITGHRREYSRSVEILKQLGAMKARGMARTDAAKQLGRTETEISAYWPYADVGELPISDRRIFPKLYFLKGATALHNLRRLLGDSTFFRGFRSVFTNAGPATGETSLDAFRSSFEAAAGRSLEEFFRTWYSTPGLPD